MNIAERLQRIAAVADEMAPTLSADLREVAAEVEALEAEAKLSHAAMTMAMNVLGPLGEAVKAELAKQPIPNAEVTGRGPKETR
jgi:hypothetical protein